MWMVVKVHMIGRVIRVKNMYDKGVLVKKELQLSANFRCLPFLRSALRNDILLELVIFTDPAVAVS